MLFSCTFILQFVFGGITGVALAQVPFDVHVHDTYFVVGHFHYIVYGGTVFVIFASIYHWFPKFTGRMLNERLGQLHLLLTFLASTFCLPLSTGSASMACPGAWLNTTRNSP